MRNVLDPRRWNWELIACVLLYALAAFYLVLAFLPHPRLQ
jgi:hypothetical protein